MFLDRPSRIALRSVMKTVLLLVVLVLASVQIAQAQQQTRIPRIGYLGANSFSVNSDRPEAFRQGLR